jgi:hypothetical protein
MSKAFAALLARRFAPLDFSTVPGFPHPVPSIDIWGDHLPRFAEKKEDNPSDHLIRFHQCMIQLDIYHEDVLMKMFVFSLEGDAREWYRSLPPSSISSLKEFHTVFHHRCERFFAREILLEGCCEEFHAHIQNVYSSNCEHEILSVIVVQEEDPQDRVDVNIDDCVTEDSLDCSSYVPTTLNKNEKDYRVGEEEDEFSAESLFKECCEKFEKHVQQEAVDSPICRDESYVVKEDLHNTNGYNENYISVDASDLISVAHAAFDLYEESVIKEDCSQIFKEVSYDSFSPVTDEKDLKMACLSLLDTEVFCSPIFDKYADEADQILTSDFADLKSNPPIYNSYEFDVDEEQYCEKISHLETPAAYIEKSPPEISKFACTILQHKSADDKEQFIINNEVSLQLYSYLHTVEGGSHDNPENMQILSTFQLKQQQEVFSFNFIDPFVYYLKSSSSIDVKLLLPNKGWLCCIFELYISIPWFPTFIFRSKVLPAIRILRWLHWKHDFT